MSCDVGRLDDDFGITAGRRLGEPMVDDVIYAGENESPSRTNRLSKEAFAALGSQMASSTAPLLISAPPEEFIRVVEAAASAGILDNFPRVCQEMLDAGFAKEAQLRRELDKISEEIDKDNEKLKHVLLFNSKLTKLPSDKDSHLITDEMRRDLEVLKTYGIDIVSPNEKKLTTEKLTLIKSDLDGIKSDLNLKTQRNFTKIQGKSSLLDSLISSLKMIQERHDRFMEKLSRNMAGNG